jgi:hypothetical protein
MAPRAEGLLRSLEECRRLRPGAPRVETLLAAVGGTPFDDAASLVRLHEALLFLRAYPHSPGVLSRAETLLRSFGRRVARLKKAGADLSPLDERETSGIAGTSIEMPFSLDVAAWLADRFPGTLGLSWDGNEATDRLGAALAPLIPLLDEEALAEANVPYPEWIAAAGRRPGPFAKREAEWLLRRFSEFPGDARERAARYDALGLWLTWDLKDSWATRTRLRVPCAEPFADDGPLLRRSDVSLADELAAGPLPVQTLSRADGQAALEACRAMMGTRYRELYAFTYGDPSNVVVADVGRGLRILVNGIVPERRLPLRAGFGVAFFRNGLPVGYADAYAALGRVGVSFNVFPAFRDGESAFVLVRLLRLYRHLLGATTFSVDPFQIGAGNDEALATGAFWFYRKLGFRSADPDLEALARRLEARVADRPGYRVSRRTLERLAGAPVLFGGAAGRADRFHVRNLGLAATRRMAATGGEPAAWREALEKKVARAAGLDLGRESRAVRRAFSGLAPVLDLVPGIGPGAARWTADEKARLRAAVRAKAGRSEQAYLRALDRLPRLRTALLRAGSVG